MAESLELEIIVRRSRFFPELWEAKVSERYDASPFAMATAVHPTNAIMDVLASIAKANEIREAEIAEAKNPLTTVEAKSDAPF